MDIPQVSISVDTSDSGALSVETCKEVILDPSDSAEHTRDDSSKDACDHVKNAVENKRSESEWKRSKYCRSVTTGSSASGNKLNHCSTMSSSSRGSLIYQPHNGVSQNSFYLL